MNGPRIRVPAIATLVVTVCLLSGCFATSAYMTKLDAQAVLAPQSGKSRVVFIRPSAFASGVKFTLFTGRGEFLGDSLPESHFAVDLPPGQKVFIVWAENTAALQANLAPGCTYFVEVASKLGFTAARAHLLAMKPSQEIWSSRQEWLDETNGLIPDRHAGQAYLIERREDLLDRVRRGKETLAEYDSEERAARTLARGDGICSGSSAGKSIYLVEGAQAMPAPARVPGTQPASMATSSVVGAVWYHEKDGRQEGPKTDKEIRAQYKDKTIGPETLVWRQGLPVPPPV